MGIIKSFEDSLKSLKDSDIEKGESRAVQADKSNDKEDENWQDLTSQIEEEYPERDIFVDEVSDL